MNERWLIYDSNKLVISKRKLHSKFIDTIKKLLIARRCFVYEDSFMLDKGEIKVGIELIDTGDETATLILAHKARLLRVQPTPTLKYPSIVKPFGKIIQGEADAFALAGRARPDAARPIEFAIYNKERSKEVWEIIKALSAYFFTP